MSSNRRIPWVFDKFPPGTKHGDMAQECIATHAEILRMLRQLREIAAKKAKNDSGDEKSAEEVRELKNDMRDLDNFARSGLTSGDQMEQLNSSSTMLHLRVASALNRVGDHGESRSQIYAQTHSLVPLQAQPEDVRGMKTSADASSTHNASQEIHLAAEYSRSAKEAEGRKRPTGSSEIPITGSVDLPAFPPGSFENPIRGATKIEIFRSGSFENPIIAPKPVLHPREQPRQPQTTRMSQYRIERRRQAEEQLRSPKTEDGPARLQKAPISLETPGAPAPRKLGLTPFGALGLQGSLSALEGALFSLDDTETHSHNTGEGRQDMTIIYPGALESPMREKPPKEGSRYPRMQKWGKALPVPEYSASIALTETESISPQTKTGSMPSKEAGSRRRRHRRLETKDVQMHNVLLAPEDCVMSRGYGPPGSLEEDGGLAGLIMRLTETGDIDDDMFD